MTKLEKAVDKYIRDKHSTDECYAYIKGWEDALDWQTSKMYWVLALGIILGISIMELITLIIK
jgi:tetrahydromethanopterin S-methyltransferase subunit B